MAAYRDQLMQVHEEEKELKPWLQLFIAQESPRVTFENWATGVDDINIFKKVFFDGKLVISYVSCNLCQKVLKRGRFSLGEKVLDHWREHVRNGECHISHI